MPGKRADGQILIAAALEQDMLALMDSTRGGRSRSQYLREAIAEKLALQGFKIPAFWINPPDRAGKGTRNKSKATVLLPKKKPSKKKPSKKPAGAA
jgi:hypothetical protein